MKTQKTKAPLTGEECFKLALLGSDMTKAQRLELARYADKGHLEANSLRRQLENKTRMLAAVEKDLVDLESVMANQVGFCGRLRNVAREEKNGIAITSSRAVWMRACDLVASLKEFHFSPNTSSPMAK